MTQDVLAKLMSVVPGGRLELLQLVIASSCLVIVPQVQVRAASITILNPSFESPALTQGTFNQAINNWTLTNGSWQGTFRPNIGPNLNFTQAVPNGSQTAYSNGGTISQTLTATLQANTQYTLGAFVGRRAAGTAFPGYSIELWAGTTLLASNGSVTPDAGTFAPVTVNYTSGSSGSLIGQLLEIRLISSIGTNAQTNFDQITLNATPIPTPEPSAILGLLGFGLLGIGSTLKQKR
ncbi:PEP-CTERM protein-sorting domain-containing protein [Microcystis aeruginosa]